MTIADQLRSFPVPPRHVLIAAATEIERLNLNLVSMQQFTDQIKTECRELRAENERLTAELGLSRQGNLASIERDIHAEAERDALRQRVTELDQQRESAFRAGYACGSADERINCDFSWRLYASPAKT